ncbi:MAG: exo-beta-N-acetylmuramidase NamZ domain-containing protein [Desulfobaccales bacterium]
MASGKSPSSLIRVIALAAGLAWLAGCASAPPPVAWQAPKPPAPQVSPAPRPAPAAAAPEVSDRRFAGIEPAVNQEIAAGNLPGAVVLVGHQDRIVYRRAFGQRALTPRPLPMTTDTIFDIASLTKVVATTTAIMQLVDARRLRLDDPVARYWPAFAANGKACLTIRQLLTHTSGLRPDVNSHYRWSGYEGALAVIAADRPIRPPGTGFLYSDINFITLGEVVHRVSGEPLEVYCAQKIFGPLGLRDTSFRPRQALQARIAPCDVQSGCLRWGEVQDPTAYRMGGVAGDAGVFSTADDLAVFVQMLLDGGESRGHRILSQEAVAALHQPQSLPGNATQRGLGWDMRSPYSRIFNAAFPAGSFGHTGYTGTSIWVDPRSRTYLIILTNRLHPSGRGEVRALRAKVAAVVAAALPMGPPAAAAALVGMRMSGHGQADGPDRVRPGIDGLAASGFAPLVGKSVGVITNHTGVDGAGRSTLSRLLQARGVRVRAIFSPEHGLSGSLDERVPSGRDPASGLPVYSLYGEVKRPTAQMLRGLDALVYDIQDVGIRYYTYITTMAYAMEAAAGAGLDFYVLDRPDPISAAVVQGPLLDPDLCSFIGYCSLPVRYGMTCGELARFFNQERSIGAKLHVVPMQGYRRGDWFDQTGLPWVSPSPNIHSLTEEILYSGVGLVESANVSVGRGTATPFEVIGAPWIAGDHLARYLNGRQLPGIAFEPVAFVPNASPYRGQRCQGVRLRLVDRQALDAPALGVEIASALHCLYPGKFLLGETLSMVGSRQVLQALKQGDDPREIARRWQPGLAAFNRRRALALLY